MYGMNCGDFNPFKIDLFSLLCLIVYFSKQIGSYVPNVKSIQERVSQLELLTYPVTLRESCLIKKK